ncbi:hypothetical protein ACGIF2_15875 [Cellulomonas sp. P22]|uniref:CBU_0592 family membrane protein n=1 Tax=Cellulomonas sp. P22 TaxID=3373189 RepID=UPI0037B10F69
MHTFITLLGWAGAFTCVVAYGLVSTGTWSASSRRYQALNIAGALMLSVVAARSQVWPSVAANVVWAVIGAHAFAMMVRSRRSPDAPTVGAVGEHRAIEADAPTLRPGSVTLVA